MLESLTLVEILVLVFALLFITTLLYAISLRKRLIAHEQGDGELIKNAYFNKLTMLPNMNNAQIVIDDQIERAKRREKKFLLTTVTLLNYSDAKAIELSDIIVEVLRNEDYISHIEDSKFLVIFNEYLEEQNYGVVITRLKESITQHKHFEVSIKTIHYPDDFVDFTTLKTLLG